MRHAVVLAVLTAVACSAADPADRDAAGGSADAAATDARAGEDGTVDGTPVSYPCEPVVTAGHQEISCPDGVHFDVEATAACAAGGCGLILDIHGLTMTGDQEEAHTRMRTLAPPLGYVVLQPTSPGTLQEWSSGTWDEGVWSFVHATRDRFAIDRDRLHVMGFSQGAMMTLRLLCAHSEEIASVAPTAGGGCFGSGAGPAVDVPILYTHGTTDALVSFPGVGLPTRDEVIASYGLGAGTPFASGASPTWQATRFTDTSGVVRLEFWQHDFTAPPLGGIYALEGHCLPGPVSGESFRCRQDGQYDHSNEILRFFQEHSRP